MNFFKILPLASILLFFIIIWNLDWLQIYQAFLEIDFLFVTVALMLNIPIITMKGFKWKTIIKTYSVDFPIANVVSSWLVGFFAGIITPGRMGDLARAYYLKERMSLGKSITTVVVDRIIDVFVLLFLSIVGITMFTVFYTTDFVYGIFFSLFSIFFFILIIYLFSRKEFAIWLLRPFSRRLVSYRHKTKASKVFHDFYSALDTLRNKKIVLIIPAGICISSWLLIFLQIYILSLSMNIGISMFFIASIMPMIALLDALPISFSGLGTRDAAMIFFFGFISLSAELAISFSLLIFIVNYILVGCVGMLFWLRNPIKIR